MEIVTTTRAVPRVLSIAGTDPTGGAGLHADLKSIAAMGGYGMGLVTALVAQNTRGVRSVHIPEMAFLREQLDAVSDDVAIDAIKIGMLGSAEIIRTVSTWFAETYPQSRPIAVVDPVMIASSGDRLLDASAESALREFLNLADVITPNLPELAVLAEAAEASTWDEARAQAETVSRRHEAVVILKGGHLAGDQAPDAVVDARGETLEYTEYPSARVETKNTHGTGCSLSSALATAIAQYGDVNVAMAVVKPWLYEAVAQADALEVGTGHGPIHHFHAARNAAEPAHAYWWRDIRPTFEATLELPFIRQLAAGTLDRNVFTYYLAQDSYYLGIYAQALEATAALAPTEDEREFFREAAHACAYEERELHNKWVEPVLAAAERSANDARLAQDIGVLNLTTRRYTDHLAAATARGNYAVAVAAVLPCFWLYSEIGKHLVDTYRLGDPHDFGEWIEAYADDAFEASTRRVIDIFDREWRAADALTRQQMDIAFLYSCELEREFFEMPTAWRTS